MYHIAICDDEAIFAGSLSEMAKKILEELHIPFLLDIYTSCNKLYEIVSDKPDTYELILLDILMDGMNGMDFAKKLRKLGSRVTIVFITSTPDFSLQGYEVQAFHYLLKPVKESALCKIFELDYRRLTQKDRITVKEGTGIRQLEINQISHLETRGRKVAVYLTDETVLVSAKMTELELKLPRDRFIRCHQSFLINMDYVTHLRHSEAVMKDNSKIPVSRAHLHNVQTSFLEKLGRI